jgi:hypothetical protein
MEEFIKLALIDDDGNIRGHYQIRLHRDDLPASEHRAREAGLWLFRDAMLMRGLWAEYDAQRKKRKAA